VVPVLAALVALAVGVGGTLLLVGGDDTDTAAPGVDPVLEQPPTEEAPPPPPPEPEPPGGPESFEGMVLTLPPGWRLEDDGAGTGCVTRGVGGCELRVLLPDVVRERSPVAFEDPDPEDSAGWHLGTDEPGCEAGFAQSRLAVRILAPVDDKQAAYREWDVTCGGDPSRPRLWWLPQSRVAFLDETDAGDEVARAAIDEIVRTVDLGERASD
jgi:hypothetical protein